MLVSPSNRHTGSYILPTDDKIDQKALKEFKKEKIKQGTEELQKKNISFKDEGALSQFFKQEFSPVLDHALNEKFGENNPHILKNRGGIKEGIYIGIKKQKV